MSTSFGQVIPVTGLNYGFPGTVSRTGKRTITARQVLPSAAHNISFGAGVVIVPASDTYQSVADFLAAAAGNAALLTASFAGVAVREVTTTFGYPYVPGNEILASYAPGAMAEALEEGSVTVFFQTAATGTQLSQNPVFVRTAANASYPSAVVGGFELFADAAVNTTGTASSGSTALTVASGTGIVVGQIVTGAGIAPNTTVAAVAGTAVTLSQNTTAALSSTAVNFASNVAIPGIRCRVPSIDANSVGEITILNRIAA